MATPAKKKAPARKATTRKATTRKAPAARKSAAPKVIDKKNRIIDLDAFAAARAEKDSDSPAPRLRFKGKLYELPRELPASFMFNLGALQAGDLTKLEPMVRSVFGTQFDAVSNQLDAGDLQIITMQLQTLYDVEAGE